MYYSTYIQPPTHPFTHPFTHHARCWPYHLEHLGFSVLSKDTCVQDMCTGGGGDWPATDTVRQNWIIIGAILLGPSISCKFSHSFLRNIGPRVGKRGKFGLRGKGYECHQTLRTRNSHTIFHSNLVSSQNIILCSIGQTDKHCPRRSRANTCIT